MNKQIEFDEEEIKHIQHLIAFLKTKEGIATFDEAHALLKQSLKEDMNIEQIKIFVQQADKLVQVGDVLYENLKRGVAILDRKFPQT